MVSVVSPIRSSFWSFAAQTLVLVDLILFFGMRFYPFGVMMLTVAPLSNITRMAWLFIVIWKIGSLGEVVDCCGGVVGGGWKVIGCLYLLGSVSVG